LRSGRITSCQHTSTTLQHMAEHCYTLQHIVSAHINYHTLHQDTATSCGMLHRTAPHYNTLQHAMANCNTLQHTSTHYNKLQHTTTRCSTLHYTAACCTTLYHTATSCSTLQHPATHCNTRCTTWLRSSCDTISMALAIWRCTYSFNCRRITCSNSARPDSYCRVLQCVVVCCRVVQRVALCCSVLQCISTVGVLHVRIPQDLIHIAGCCHVLQCVKMCCSVLWYVSVCCSVPCWNSTRPDSAAVYCDLLQCVAVCCSVLQ